MRTVIDAHVSPPAVFGVCYHTVPQLRDGAVRIDYDAETDRLRIVLKEAPVRESEEERSSVILDYDANGQLAVLVGVGDSFFFAIGRGMVRKARVSQPSGHHLPS